MPPEIRTVRITRGPRVLPQAMAALPDANARLRRSIFGQLFTAMHAWPDSSLRRSYVGINHDGQKRAFAVALLGEGADDNGGPYRAIFENVVRELQTDSLPLPDGHPCLLPFFIPCPNRSGGTHTAGSSDGFVMNPGPNARSASALSFYQFLGKLVGIAVRHGLQLGLQLSPLVWRVVAGLPLGVEDLLQVDARAPAPGRSGSNPPAGAETVAASDGSTCLTLPDKVAAPSLAHRAALARLRESEPQLAAFRSGIASVVPVELLGLMREGEVEELVCGIPDVRVQVLQAIANCDRDAPHVKWLWEVLEEATPEERSEFLQFVWARSRLPATAAMVATPFRIDKAAFVPEGKDPDAFLPKASTCFFTLNLPAYSSKEVLRQRLFFAMKHSPNMDADVVLHSAEGWADM